MNTIKIQGIESQYVKKIHESVKICDAIKEFVDNSIDAGATNVDVIFNGTTLIVKDNSSKGMVGKLEKFASDYESHIVDGKDNDTIGIKGVGAKDAILRLSDYTNNGSTITILTSNGNKAQKLTWVICKATNDINEVTITDVDVNSVDVGTTIRISNPCDVSGNVMSQVKRSLAYAYSFKLKFKGLSIKFRENHDKCLEMVKPTDYFYLDKLCGENGEHLDRLTTPGNYDCDGIYFIVRNNVFERNDKTCIVTIPAIQLFITDRAKITEDIKDKDAYAGAKFGAIFNERYITNDKTTEKQQFNRALNRGGAWRCRTLIFVNNESYDLLSGKSNKSKGIKPLCGNEDLIDYSLVLNHDIADNIKDMYQIKDKKNKSIRNMNIYETLEEQYLWMTRINTKRTDGNEITLDIVKDVTSNKCIEKPKVNTGDYNVTESKNFITLDCKNKEIVCTIEKLLNKHKISKDKKASILTELLENMCKVA